MQQGKIFEGKKADVKNF